MKNLILITLLTSLVSCGSFQAERVSGDESDEKSLEITDAWVTRDTENTVGTVLSKMKVHKGFKNYRLKLGRRPKVFVAEFNNQTAEPYFPSDDISDEFLETIYTPAGLHIGAQTPEEIAVSIVAEILSVIRKKEPFSLRKLNGKIHS